MTETETHEAAIGDIPDYNEITEVAIEDTNVLPTAHGDRPRVAITVERETTETLPMALHDEAVWLHSERQRRNDSGGREASRVRPILQYVLPTGIALTVATIVMDTVMSGLAGETVTFEPVAPVPSVGAVAVLILVLAAIVFVLPYVPPPTIGGVRR